MIKFFSVLCVLLLFSFNQLNAQNFSTHQVKKGETVEGIAKQYQITPSEIYNLNPDAKEELKPNTVLIIPISKSKKPKVTIVKELDGFKTHKTKKKETLYSLSKKYDVTIDDIKKYNTSLYAAPLRKGDKIQIPVYKITETEAEIGSKKYTVLPKEGKWRIAYKYGITIEELEALNPGMGDVLKEGQEINVPDLNKEEENVVDEQYSYYKVLPKEGFYRLKLKLGLEKSELEELNPELIEGGLKNGMILKVPFSEKTAVLAEDREVIDLTKSISNFDTKHIAIMLPFRLNVLDSVYDSDAKRGIKKDPFLRTSLDFHSGVLMALDSLKQLGVSLKVDIYDTKYKVSEVSKIIKDNDFENLDAVIGPLTSRTFEQAALELRKYHVPIVSPIGKKLKLHDNVFQAKPDSVLIKNKIVNFVKSDSLVTNVVVVHDTKSLKLANALKQEFNQAKLVKSRKDKKGKDEYFILVNDIKSALKPGKNIVFLETTNEGFASNVTSLLASLISENPKARGAIDIILITTEHNSAFEGDEISNEHLSKLKFHFATYSKYYNENDNNGFVKKYKKAYGITPNMKVVKGFDLTMDVVLRLVSSEDLYTSTETAPLTEYVENKFAYKKKEFGGYYNDAIYLVKYDNLNIVEVKQ